MRRAALLAALLAAASGARAALGPRYGGELTIALPRFGASDPRAAHTAADRVALGLLDDTLVRLDRDGAVRASLAAGWSPSALGREWSFRLDGSARFHDDSAVASSDVAASLRRFLKSDSSAADALAEALVGGSAFRAGASADLPGLQVTGSDSVTLLLSRPSASLLASLAAPAASIRNDGGRGAGAFAPVLEVPGRRLLARAHPGHVRGRPFLERVLLLARARDPLAEAGLASGGGAADVQALLLLALDASRPPFAAPELRSALDAALDRTDLSQRVSGALPRFGFSQPAPRSAASPSARRFSAAVPLAVEEDVPPAVSQRIVALLGSLGLRAEVRVVPGAEIRAADAVAKLLLFLPEVDEPGLLLREAAGLVKLERLRARVDAADAEPLAARRRELLREVEAQLLLERTLLPLAALPVGVAAPEGTHGLRFDAVGRLLVEDAWREAR